jgi:hypothetical protein
MSVEARDRNSAKIASAADFGGATSVAALPVAYALK